MSWNELGRACIAWGLLYYVLERMAVGKDVCYVDYIPGQYEDIFDVYVFAVKTSFWEN